MHAWFNTRSCSSVLTYSLPPLPSPLPPNHKTPTLTPLPSTHTPKQQQISPVIMMFYLNAFSSVFSLITLVHTRELSPFVGFIMKHPSIHLHFWLFSICSTIGQVGQRGPADG